METMEKQVKNCKTLCDVRRVVEDNGGVQGSSHFYSPEAFNTTLIKVVEGELPVMYITRSFGLRDKVAEILDIKIQ